MRCILNFLIDYWFLYLTRMTPKRHLKTLRDSQGRAEDGVDMISAVTLSVSGTCSETRANKIGSLH